MGFHADLQSWTSGPQEISGQAPAKHKEECRDIFHPVIKQTLPGISSMPGTELSVEMKKIWSLPLISSQYNGWKRITK